MIEMTFKKLGDYSVQIWNQFSYFYRLFIDLIILGVS